MIQSKHNELCIKGYISHMNNLIKPYNCTKTISEVGKNESFVYVKLWKFKIILCFAIFLLDLKT